MLEELDPISLTTVQDPRVVDTKDKLLEPMDQLTSKFYEDYEAMVTISGKLFEGRLRSYKASTGPEKE